ncbi:MAG: ABC transporter permease [Phycisphaeraceae bacterium]|nr:ABC transporter permease [Phycisphaeraceae bacterium]
MYKQLLILKYLRRKLAPMFAVLAVMLCTAMVIIVISVMGGFLRMMRASAAKLTGEVTIYSDLTGFPNYEELSALLAKLPEVEAVTPVIRTYGLVRISENTRTVEVMGIEPESFNKVCGYKDTLHWKTGDLLAMLQSSEPLPSDMPEDVKRKLQERQGQLEAIDLTDAGMTFAVPSLWTREQAKDAVVLGIEVSPWARRDVQGRYAVENSALSSEALLTVLPLTQKGTFASMSPALRKFVVVNEFKSGLYEIDSNRLYVSFTALQSMLDMQSVKVWKQRDPETGEGIGEPVMQSGRASELMIKGKPGVALATLDQRVREIVELFAGERPAMPRLWVQTWEERHHTLLSAVEKEKGLLTVLFSVISLVAIVMIAVIFYMIVLEKTRDIGTLRALGASRTGVAGIFLGYGIVIGVLGAGLGLALAATIVHYLNEIQDLLYVVFGFKMWDPRVYYFDRIPSQIDTTEVTVIVIIAVLSSLVGSVIPAYLASRLNPIEALRYE